ncbi:MAG: 3-dehydroquinate synthase [Synechococcus sp. MIT S9220]|uniref:3-dehydroquinate synthase n=1 Tax=unclassified Synechococcus TaxID=2626047 RepID=UPI00164CA193|nr:3-dehydroquinate synthase [Synechococcus sp. MIT S9220]NOL47082.1 3-dehydroquinate synthase [Synechococcus sp. MIT S9220]
MSTVQAADLQERTTITVSLERNPYDVIIGRSMVKDIGSALADLPIRSGTKILVVSNPDVARPYGDSCLSGLRAAGFNPVLLEIDAGEERKTLQTLSLILDKAQREGLERTSLMLALGGGVVGDMTGFAAACWLRGIGIVQVPTTLLSMVDASIGGKTGVNHPKGKNLIGAFHQPRLVVIDPLTLNTLPVREFRAGMAEVIKYGVIGDPDLFSRLEEASDLSNPAAMDPTLLHDILVLSAEAKAAVVADDEREGGQRAILNYGHTFGHVVETLTGYGTWLHGEAVAIGMAAVGRLAVQKGLWSEADQQRQLKLIEKAGLPVAWPSLDRQAALRTLQGDKKVRHGRLRFVLPTRIGNVIISDEISNEDVSRCLASLN